MQNFNYHTHTKRCGHAVGEDREYPEAAIEGGFSVLGMSDHIPFPDWDDPRERMAFAETEEYLQAMSRLKREYEGRIRILTGFEFEYFDDAVGYLREIKERVDYLIVGQHAKNRQDYYYDQQCTDEDVRIMRNQLIGAIENIGIVMVAHPDYFMMGRDRCGANVLSAMRDVAECAKAYDVPIEWNLKGAMRNERRFAEGMRREYPFHEIWEEIAKVGPRIVIGYDAHFPDMLRRRKAEEEARNELKSRYGLYALEEYEIGG